VGRWLGASQVNRNGGEWGLTCVWVCGCVGVQVWVCVGRWLGARGACV